MNIHHCTGLALKLARDRIGINREVLVWQLNCKKGIEMTVDEVKAIEELQVEFTEGQEERYDAWCDLLGKKPQVIQAEAEAIDRQEQKRKKPNPPLM